MGFRHRARPVNPGAPYTRPINLYAIFGFLRYYLFSISICHRVDSRWGIWGPDGLCFHYPENSGIDKNPLETVTEYQEAYENVDEGSRLSSLTAPHFLFSNNHSLFGHTIYEGGIFDNRAPPKHYDLLTCPDRSLHFFLLHCPLSSCYPPDSEKTDEFYYC
ncbi:unnamed protein product [Caenorhabditis brenneri]